MRERRIFTTEEVLELLKGDDDNTQINYDSSESEIEDDGDGAVIQSEIGTFLAKVLLHWRKKISL